MKQLKDKWVYNPETRIWANDYRARRLLLDGLQVEHFSHKESKWAESEANPYDVVELIIAQTLGWKGYCAGSGHYWHDTFDPEDKLEGKLPKYGSSLDGIHEAEKFFLNRDESDVWETYKEELGKLTFDIVHSPVRARALAFILTLPLIEND